MKQSNFPETSRIAHVSKSEESKQRDYDRIVLALEKLGSGNYEDIARSMGERELNVVSRRLLEMVKKDLVENTGIKKLTSRNRPAFIYKLSSVSKSPTQLVDDIISQAKNNSFKQLNFFTNDNN